MAIGQPKSKTDKRNLLFGIVVLFLLLSLLAAILAANIRQPEPVTQQEVITTPPPVKQPAPAAAPTAIVAAPVIAKPKPVAPVAPKPRAAVPAPRQQVAAKPQAAKPATVVAVNAVETPRPAPKKVAPPTSRTVKKPATKPPQGGYRKLAHDGTSLPDNATDWACVQDRATGLIWEVKTDDNSIRDRDNFYTWYQPADDRNYGRPGARDGGRCKGGADCDTLAYVEAINQQRLCGFADWRLPVKEELLGLVEYKHSKKQTKATINQDYFPHAAPSWYWTGSSNPKKPDYAWFVLFRNGLALNALKEQPKHVRLVRGGIRGTEQSGQTRLNNLASVTPQF